MRLTLLLFSLVVLSGCSPTPDALRGLKPVAVTVQDDGKPIEGIIVSLNPKEAKALSGCNGVTDSSGTAIIRTSVQQQSAAGALPGEYKVLLQQTFAVPDDLEVKGTTYSPEQQAKRKSWIDKHRIIPEIFESTGKTPIDLTVDEKDGAKLVIDVSKHRTK